MLDSELSMFFAIAHCNIPMKTKDMGEIVCNSIASDISLEQKRVPIKGGNNILTRETKNQQIIVGSSGISSLSKYSYKRRSSSSLSHLHSGLE